MSIYNPTCFITGSKENLVMHPIRNDNNDMIGWVFVVATANMDKVNAKIQWEIKASVVQPIFDGSEHLENN